MAIVLFIFWVSFPLEFGNTMYSTSKYQEKGPWIELDSLAFPEKIMDYCHLFHENLDYEEFKNFTYLQAHAHKSFTVETLAVSNAYLAFHTGNTPPDMDGDSEEEWAYAIKYWDLANGTRFIALTKTLVTWVSEETVFISFYLQEGTNLEKVNWEGFSWNLGDFIGHEVASYFDNEIWENPPVVIELPPEGVHIEVSLAFHEYMQNRKAFEVYDSLKFQMKEKKLLFDAVNQNGVKYNSLSKKKF